MIKFSTTTPNFSLVLPGGCNASCPFCFWKEDKSLSPYRYLMALDRALGSLPDIFQQISITGGEPTASPILGDVFDLLREHRQQGRWQKVVLTTNGFKLRSATLKGAVDHVNISRHAVDDKANQGIFKTTDVPRTADIKTFAHTLNTIGVDVTLNVVCDLKAVDYLTWISYAKDVGASAIAFRIDQKYGLEGMNVSEQKLVGVGHAHRDSGCPVCRTRTFLIDGMQVHFKYGLMEPSKVQPYELILQQNGQLTLDWAGKMLYAATPKTSARKITQTWDLGTSCSAGGGQGCGAGGCGIGSSNCGVGRGGC